MTSTITLPAAFKELECFSTWSLPTTAERKKKRFASTSGEMKEFYAAIAPRTDEILTYLNQYPLNEIPADTKSLFHLVLAAAEMGIYVEWFEGEAVSPIARPVGGRVEMVDEPKL
jgi:hypothetical protein